ncbi:hypothetical protein [Anabaena sp. CCY 9402-a]|uniref:hypothetical protein n=1 Tax=Anabaena sp. CCY 9402-a TaxID=3103867 RepID=UPI0039C6C3D7
MNLYAQCPIPNLNYVSVHEVSVSDTLRVGVASVYDTLRERRERREVHYELRITN